MPSYPAFCKLFHFRATPEAFSLWIIFHTLPEEILGRILEKQKQELAS